MRTRYLATGIAALLVVGTAGAQEKRAGGMALAGIKGTRDGVFTEGVTLVYVRPSLPVSGTNMSVIIQEDALSTGFQDMLRRHAQCHTMFLKLFDEDKDGTLNTQEGQAARAFAFSLMGTMRYDNNRDWKVDEAEADQLWNHLTEAYQRYNEAVMKKLDRNQDGELDDTERKTAAEQTGQWRRRDGQ